VDFAFTTNAQTVAALRIAIAGLAYAVGAHEVATVRVGYAHRNAVVIVHQRACGAIDVALVYACVHGLI
jgi:hypothetical protein